MPCLLVPGPERQEQGLWVGLASTGVPLLDSGPTCTPMPLLSAQALEIAKGQKAGERLLQEVPMRLCWSPGAMGTLDP